MIVDTFQRTIILNLFKFPTTRPLGGTSSRTQALLTNEKIKNKDNSNVANQVLLSLLLS